MAVVADWVVAPNISPPSPFKVNAASKFDFFSALEDLHSLQLQMYAPKFISCCIGLYDWNGSSHTFPCNLSPTITLVASRLRHAATKMQSIKCAVDASFGNTCFCVFFVLCNIILAWVFVSLRRHFIVQLVMVMVWRTYFSGRICFTENESAWKKN